MEELLRENRYFLLIISAFSVSQLYLVHFTLGKPLLWDSSVYLAMGKWIFSLAEIGFWENFRPPVLPVFLGLLWKSGLPGEWIRIFSSLVSVAGLAVIYWISRRLFGRTEALVASGLLASTYTFFYFSLNPLTGILASALVFSGLYLAVENKYYTSGAVLALAFLTRFPAALAVPAAVSFIIFRSYEGGKLLTGVQDSLKLGAAFVTVTSPYFLAQYWFFGSILSPFIRSISITAGAGSDYLYGLSFLLKAARQNALYLLTPVGAYLAIRNREMKYYVYVIALAAFYGFFSLFPLKIERYMLLFLPLMALFSGKALDELAGQLSIDSRKVLAVLAALFTILVVLTAFDVYKAYNWENPEQEKFFNSVSGLEGEVASNDPRVNVYGDFRYYPLPPGDLSKVIERHGKEIDHWAINDRYWDCRGYQECRSEIKDLESYLESNYRVSSKVLANGYNYTIYSRIER